LVPLIRGFINPSVVIIQKELLFKKDFFFRSTIFIFDSFASVFFVLLLRSPSGIVLGLIFGAMLEVMISIAFLRPIPKLEIKKNYVKQIFHKGKWVTFSGVFNYLYHNLDDVVVGRLAGIGSLGLYGMAYNFSTLPISEIADVLSKVTFPVYVKIGGDINRLKKAFFKTIIFVSLLSFPLGLVIIIFPSQIIHLVLGENWIEAAPALQILGIFGIIRAISGTTSSLFLAVQKQKYVAVVTFVSFVALGIFVIPLVLLYGIVGASIASVIGAIAALPVMAYYTHRVLYINEKSRS
jgi:O-antigen/teichoic acid export membrane protein